MPWLHQKFEPCRFSAKVLPVTVSVSPWIKSVCLRRYLQSCQGEDPAYSELTDFNTAGTPPTLLRSSIRYFPDGRKSARYGVRLEMGWKSSMLRGTSAARAIANRWRTCFQVSPNLRLVKDILTAFVDPPNTLTKVMAFSKDFFVRISLNRIHFRRDHELARLFQRTVA